MYNFNITVNLGQFVAVKRLEEHYALHSFNFLTGIFSTKYKYYNMTP